ncbi:MAG: glycine zipper domain-containing protein [Planctomycetota bacterium]|jgi:hypothetical protein
MSLSARTISTTILFGMLAITPVDAQEGTRNGALLGGATGAVIGGIIGNNKNDQTAEGALIGGAVGAVTGGLIGHQRDKAIAEQQRQARAARSYYAPSYPSNYPYGNSSSYYHRFAGPGQPTIVQSGPVVTRYGVSRPPTRSIPMPARQPVTMADVLHMTRSGVSDPVIVSRIQTNGMAQSPSVDEVIFLSQEGVSDHVIAAMQGDPRGELSMGWEGSPEMRVPAARNQRRGF